MARYTEVEAKFKVADRAVFDQLLRIERLGRFSLSDGPLLDVTDIYMDTAGRALSAGGYACRLRCENGEWFAILKGLGGSGGAVHQREEVKTVLPAFEPDPARWPEGDTRELALALSGGEPLGTLLTLRQARRARMVSDGARDAAVLSLDEVQVEAGRRADEYLELEAEALPAGTLEDVEALAALFAGEWSLEPQPDSKYHRAMALLDSDRDRPAPAGAAGGAGLEPSDRPVLERIVEMDDPRYNRRARLLLAWDDGADVRTLREQLAYSRSRVYYWLHAYQTRGLAAFPAAVLAAARERPGGAPERPAAPGAIGLAELFRRHRVDMEHARHVADLALALFDRSSPYHGLSEASRRFLEQGALLHNVGLNADPDRHHAAGRDILLETPLVEFTEAQRRMLAAMIYLHRKAISPKKLEKKWIADLPKAQRKETLEMAALIRMADGLDYSLSQTTRVVGARVARAGIEIVVAGPEAEMDAARAEEKADLWNHLHAERMTFRLREEGPGAGNGGNGGDDVGPEAIEIATTDRSDPVPVQAAEVAPAEARPEPPRELALLEKWLGDSAPGIKPDEPMSEAGRKLLRFHLIRVLQHELGTRLGEDIEELHDMRVATRRLRSSFRLFEEFYVPKRIGPLVKGLRRAGGLLGAVRDLDVLLLKAREYLGGLPAGRQNGLDPLLESWQASREAARQAMIKYLDGQGYRHFVRDFVRFVSEDGAGAVAIDAAQPTPYLVRHVVPRVIYWHYERVRAYEPWLADPELEVLHALRIECKRLRYALEFFREVLGPEAKGVIAEVTAIQDHLGNLHDADVADHLLRDFLAGGMSVPHAAGQSPAARRRVVAPGVVLYLAEKQVELQDLMASFPEAWSHLNRPEVRRDLAAAISVL